MKIKTNKSKMLFSVVFLLILVIPCFASSTYLARAQSTQDETGWQLIGTYNVNYRYNAAGSPYTPGGAYNPWYANYIPPGPYYLDPSLTPPGHYKAVVTAWGEVYGNAAIWDGNIQGGNLYPLDYYVGYTQEFDHTGSQIVIYAIDWYPWDNPDSHWSTVELWRQMSPVIVINSPAENGVYSPNSGQTYSFSAIDTNYPNPTVVATVTDSQGNVQTVHSGQSLPTTDGVYQLTVTATNQIGISSTKAVTFTINSPSSIASNFNGNTIGNGSYVWFNSVLTLKTPKSPSSPFIVHFTGQTISFIASGNSYTINVPDSSIIFDPTATTATTTIDYNSTQYGTTVPSTYTGNVFLSGVVFQVPDGGLPGGIHSVTWNGTFSASAPFSIQWKWAAAVYKFPNGAAPDNNALGVKLVDSNTLSAYHNSDHAGTVEYYKNYVTGGATGGGGSNYTGGYSGTASVSG